jgi:hypothetical protein
LREKRNGWGEGGGLGLLLLILQLLLVQGIMVPTLKKVAKKKIMVLWLSQEMRDIVRLEF